MNSFGVREDDGKLRAQECCFDTRQQYYTTVVTVLARVAQSDNYNFISLLITLHLKIYKLNRRFYPLILCSVAVSSKRQYHTFVYFSCHSHWGCILLVALNGKRRGIQFAAYPKKASLLTSHT